MRVSTRSRLSLLAVTSMVIAVGTGTTAHAVSPHAPTVTETLSALGGTTVPNGDLTITEYISPNAVTTVNVGYVLTPDTAAGAALATFSFDCGQGTTHGGGPVDPSMKTGLSVSTYCTYSTPGVYHVTTTATDDEAVPQTTSVTHTVTIPSTAVDRYDGDTRYGTGVVVSQAAFPVAGSADAVILARGDVFADALSGIPLAKYKNGPLLLTPGGASVTALDPNVQAELIRVLPRNKQHTVYILGGVGAIPQTVEDYISGTLGYTTVRLSGNSRFDTALAVATDPRALNNPQNTVVARGDDFADALAAGPFAADIDKDVNGVPAAIVLSSGSGLAGSPAVLTQATANYLSAKFAAGQKVLAVGGGAHTAVIALPGGSSHSTSIVGGDRYTTAFGVASEGWGSTPPGLPLQALAGIASGLSFPDALTGGAYMALKGGPILLTDKDYVGEMVRYWNDVFFGEAGLTDVAVFGGPNVITPGAVGVISWYLYTDQSRYTDHHLAF